MQKAPACQPPRLAGYEFTAAEVADAVSRKAPLVVFLAYNDRCNLACPFCFTGGGKRSSAELKAAGKSAGSLTLPNLKDLVGQSAKLGVKSICIYGEGEPLLNKRLLFALLAEIKKHGMAAVVFTNGTLIDAETAARLFSSGATVVGKLYSFCPETNELLTGNRGLYDYAEIHGERVPAYVQRLLDAGFAGSHRFALHTVITRANAGELGRMWKWERSLGIIPYMDFLYLPHELDITESERALLREAIQQIDRRLGFSYPPERLPRLGHRVCNTQTSLFISANGFVRLCAATYLFIGDARDEPLRLLMERKLEKERELGRCGARSLFCDCYKWNKEKMKNALVIE